MTLYDDLELSPECTLDDIKQQYRLLASRYHPDRGGDEERFKRIKFAYEVLSDPVRRKQYDENKTTFVSMDIHNEAKDRLAKLFFGLIPNFDCRNGNLLDTMRAEINANIASVNDSITLNNTYIDNLNVVKDKIKLKNPTEENMILSFVEQHLGTRARDKDFFEYQLKVLDYTLQMLDQYNYGFLELPDTPEPS
jgi:curved DNA-binding protein CbpA